MLISQEPFVIPLQVALARGSHKTQPSKLFLRIGSNLAVEVLHGVHVVGVRGQRLGEHPGEEALSPAALGVGAVGPVHALRAHHDELDRLRGRQREEGLTYLRNLLNNFETWRETFLT